MDTTSTIGITGFGAYLPKLMHTNETLPALDEPVPDEEVARIGVYRRGWAGENEGIADMAVGAATRALERAKLDPADLDLLILANWTQRRYIPEFAPLVQRRLGASRAFAFDVCCACTGFVYGVGTASAFLGDRRFSRALVVASETTSKRARPGSKGTLILGDAAGAFVLERGATHGGRLFDYELATYGEHHDIMSIDERGYVVTHIPQRELNTIAARGMAESAERLLSRNGLSLNDVAWLVPHSGTAGVQAAVAKALPIPKERILTNFADVGNVSSASIPTALEHFFEAGVIHPGDLVLSVAVGTGWYGGAMLYSL